MSSERQMKRGKNQALYKYLPETWIDFSVRGNERIQYIAKVDRWNSEKLAGINSKRLLRTVSEAVRSFEKQASECRTIEPTVGFGTKWTKNSKGFYEPNDSGAVLTPENCDVLTPKAGDKEHSVIAKISPLTFYCTKCYKVYKFNSESEYREQGRCTNPGCNNPDRKNPGLSQLRQIYFCKCGYATDAHNLNCPTHGNKHIKWDGKVDFICTECNKKFSMEIKCPMCKSNLRPRNALDPAQFFVFSLNLIDKIDERLEGFTTKTNYGSFITFAHWLGMISKEELDEIIEHGIISDPEAYKQFYAETYKTMFEAYNDETEAANEAKAAADQKFGGRFTDVVKRVKTRVVTDESLSGLAEQILEYDLVARLDGASDLASAAKVATSLRTNAQPQRYAEIAERFGIKSARVCDGITFVTCSYGYTRKETGASDGVQLHALKEEKRGRKNIYATSLNTEGVLFEFDRGKIIRWLLANGFIAEADAPDLNSEEELKLWFLNNIKPSLIQPFSGINEFESKETYYVYRLIHSLSHILIRAAADIGGLGKDSMSEYIFPNVPAVLIYCQNSQGFNLGSLFNLFEAYFDKWIERAYKNAQKCVFDPICLDRQKACAGCLFLNEVSCRHFNRDLDRALVVGHSDRETETNTIGFWEDNYGDNAPGGFGEL